MRKERETRTDDAVVQHVEGVGEHILLLFVATRYDFVKTGPHAEVDGAEGVMVGGRERVQAGAEDAQRDERQGVAGARVRHGSCDRAALVRRETPGRSNCTLTRALTSTGASASHGPHR